MAISRKNLQATLEPTVRMLLRQATQPYHDHLNQHPLLVGLTTSESTLENYHKVIVTFCCIYQGLETRIFQYLATHPTDFDYTARTKLPWLLADINLLPYDPEVPESISNPIQSFPEITDIGGLIGVLYVIEGSMLGGQLISRNLVTHHGLSVDQGARFYSGYGDETATMWRDFLIFAETICGDQAQCLKAVERACQTFDLFTQTLDKFLSQKFYGVDLHS